MSNDDAPENMPKSLQDVEDYSPDKVPATDDFALEGTLFLIPPSPQYNTAHRIVQNWATRPS